MLKEGKIKGKRVKKVEEANVIIGDFNDKIRQYRMHLIAREDNNELWLNFVDRYYMSDLLRKGINHMLHESFVSTISTYRYDNELLEKLKSKHPEIGTYVEKLLIIDTFIGIKSYRKDLTVDQMFKIIDPDTILIEDDIVLKLIFHEFNPKKEDSREFNMDAVYPLLSSDIENVKLAITMMSSMDLTHEYFNLSVFYFNMHGWQRSEHRSLLYNFLTKRVPFMKEILGKYGYGQITLDMIMFTVNTLNKELGLKLGAKEIADNMPKANYGISSYETLCGLMNTLDKLNMPYHKEDIVEKLFKKEDKDKQTYYSK